MDAAAQGDGTTYGRWLAVTALAYVVAHHVGVLPGGLGPAPEDTQWADWLDLLLPFVVLGPAAAVLREASASPRWWTTFVVGAVLYAMGDGIHLAANSVDNAQGGRTAHLWDEVVGHLVWYAGVAVVLGVLASTMPGRPRPGPLGHVLGVAVGLTWATNAIGGGTEVPSLLAALGAAWFGWTRRDDLALVLLSGSVPAAVVIVVALVAPVAPGG